MAVGLLILVSSESTFLFYSIYSAFLSSIPALHCLRLPGFLSFLEQYGEIQYPCKLYGVVVPLGCIIRHAMRTSREFLLIEGVWKMHG